MNERQCQTHATTSPTCPSASHVSEVARFRQQIALEYTAAQRGLTGLSSGTARHDFITKRCEAIWKCKEQLTPLVGEDEARKIVCETVNQCQENQEPSSPKGLAITGTTETREAKDEPV